jgi:hypothetical protein
MDNSLNRLRSRLLRRLAGNRTGIKKWNAAAYETDAKSSTSRIGSILGLLFLMAFIVAFGMSSTLTCTRGALGKSVSCTKQSTLLWLIPLGQEQIHGLLDARLHIYDGYNIELVAVNGDRLLNHAYFSSPWAEAEFTEAMEQIKSFVQGESHSDSLVIDDKGGAREVLLIVMMLYSILILWPQRNKIGTLFSRTPNA